MKLQERVRTLERRTEDSLGVAETIRRYWAERMAREALAAKEKEVDHAR